MIERDSLAISSNVEIAGIRGYGVAEEEWVLGNSSKLGQSVVSIYANHSLHATVDGIVHLYVNPVGCAPSQGEWEN